MKEIIITFQVAKLAKEKGFDLPVLYHYWLENKEWELRPNEESVREVDIFTTGCSIAVDTDALLDNYDVEGNPKIFKAAPTQSLLQKWLREKHNLIIIVYLHKEKKISGIIYKYIFLVHYENEIKGLSSYTDGTLYEIYEEALEIALFEALKLINNE